MTDLQEKAMRMALEALDTLLAENNVANREYAAKAIEALRKALAQPEQEREWVGLTNEEFLEVCQLIERGNYLVALRRVQAKLKEKNFTGESNE